MDLYTFGTMYCTFIFPYQGTEEKTQDHLQNKLQSGTFYLSQDNPEISSDIFR